MAVQRFEELNTLRGYADIYYSKLNLPDAIKKKRIDLCMEFTELMLLLFYMMEGKELQDFEYIAFLEERLRIIAQNYLEVENLAYINDWSKKQAKIIVEETEKMFEEELDDYRETNEEQDEQKQQEETRHFEEFGVDVPKKQYPTSGVRAVLLAIQCNTSVYNYSEYYQAVQMGYQRKVWRCTHIRTRESHLATEGQDRAINDLFDVNGEQMLIPGDITYDPSLREICGCNCTVDYY